jgi:7-cyano-7-deazaguanine synthase
MVVNRQNEAQAVAVLFSAGLDSAVLLAEAASSGPAVPIYVAAGLAWESAEQSAIDRLLTAPPYRKNVAPVVKLQVDMRDVFPSTHWAVRGVAPAFDTADEDVYIDGRNIILLSKTAVFMARSGLRRVLIGPLAGNPFPDASPAFFRAMEAALTEGLHAPISIEAPYASRHKEDVIRTGAALGVPFELTLSCMQPVNGLHCGRCSKCRERRDAFLAAGIEDPTRYAEKPPR